ncbi:MAG: ATP-binding protein [Candidatus Krumholzibacteriota bacterium]
MSPKPFRRRVFRLTALLLVVIAVATVFLWDVRKRVSFQEEMMVAHGRAIADIVAESSIHNLGAFNQWEREVNQRLINNALWLARLDEAGALNTEVLRDFAGTMGLFRILVFDAAGRLETANPIPPGRGAGYGNLPRDFLDPLLKGEKSHLTLGYRTVPRKGEQRFTAGAARKGGGAVVVNVQADELLASRGEMGPGHLIKSLGTGRGVHYVVIQDETGIQAASTDQLAFPFPADDPHLQPLQEGAEWVVREFDSTLGGVFEIARIVNLPSGPVLLRVGMDSALLVKMRADIRTHAILRIVVLLVSVFLITALFLAWQRQNVLDREVAKVSAQLRQREAEARRTEKLVAMGSLAAGVAHQIRNPLNSIHMISQVLEKTPGLPDGVQDQARHVLTESGRIEGIIQQFLQFAKPRQPDFEMVDLAGLVRDVVGIQAAAHEGTGINFSAYAPGLDAEVDRKFVVEILENLLKNAVQALAGKGKVLVSLIARGEVAEIVVADDGPGVAPGDRDRIFDLYYTTRPEGNGLGLSLVAQMAAAMGGALSLDSEPGLDHKGARFVVILPLHRTSAERTSR